MLMHPAYLEYRATEQRARNTYLTAVIAAQAEWLAQTRPAQLLFDRSERAAWMAYHNITVAAWRRYAATQDTDLPATPPGRTVTATVPAGPSWPDGVPVFDRAPETNPYPPIGA